MQSIHTRRDFLKKSLLALSGFAIGIERTQGAVVKRLLPSVDLDFITSRVHLMPRSEWTEAGPKAWLLREAENYDRLTLHHAGNSVNFHTERNAVIHDIDGILTAHMERNYGDIGYHFIIDYAGGVWEGRSLAYEGAHVSSQNKRNIGVMLLGNFQKQKPSSKQLYSMKQIVSLLQDRYRIKRYRIYGHRDLGESICPGKNLYPYVLKLKGQE